MKKSKHATVRLGDYNIPLIGIPPDATLEICDVCGKMSYFCDVELVELIPFFKPRNQWICKKCKEKK